MNIHVPIVADLDSVSFCRSGMLELSGGIVADESSGIGSTLVFSGGRLSGGVSPPGFSGSDVVGTVGLSSGSTQRLPEHQMEKINDFHAC